MLPPGRSNLVTRPTRIGSIPPFEDNWNGRRRKSGRQRRRGRGCGNHRHLTTNKIARHRRQAIILAVRPAVFDRNILAINEACFGKALEKGRHLALVPLVPDAASINPITGITGCCARAATSGHVAATLPKKHFDEFPSSHGRLWGVTYRNRNHSTSDGSGYVCFGSKADITLDLSQCPLLPPKAAFVGASTLTGHVYRPFITRRGQWATTHATTKSATTSRGCSATGQAQRDALATVRRFNTILSAKGYAMVLAQDCGCSHREASLADDQLR